MRDLFLGIVEQKRNQKELKSSMEAKVNLYLNDKTYENILKKAGVVLKIEKEIDERSLLKELFSDEKAGTTTIDDLKEKSKKELEELLKIAVKNENYESAAKIRDEISNR